MDTRVFDVPEDVLRIVIGFLKPWEIAHLDSAVCNSKHRPSVQSAFLRVNCSFGDEDCFIMSGSKPISMCEATLWAVRKGFCVSRLNLGLNASLLSKLANIVLSAESTCRGIKVTQLNLCLLSSGEEPLFETFWDLFDADNVDIHCNDKSVDLFTCLNSFPVEKIRSFQSLHWTISEVVIGHLWHNLQAIDFVLPVSPTAQILWMRFLDRCRATMTMVTVRTEYSDTQPTALSFSDYTSTWPSVTSLTLLYTSRIRVGETIPFECVSSFVASCLRKATNLRQLDIPSCLLTLPVAMSLLEFQLWKPRTFDLTVTFDCFSGYPGRMIEDLRQSDTVWENDHPPTTYWVFDKYNPLCSTWVELLQFLPVSAQRLKSYNSESDSFCFPSVWLSEIEHISLNSSYCIDNWSYLWRSPQLASLDLRAMRVANLRPLHYFAHELTSITSTVSRPSPTIVEIEISNEIDFDATGEDFEELTRSQSTQLLSSLVACYGHSLLHLHLRGLLLSREDVVTFIRLLPRLDELEVIFRLVEDSATATPSIAASATAVKGLPRRRTGSDVLTLCMVIPVGCTVQDATKAVLDIELVWHGRPGYSGETLLTVGMATEEVVDDGSYDRAVIERPVDGLWHANWASFWFRFTANS